ncbi:uncharacterized protein LOC129716732 [Wyeomyia smithii]|uniref:uncharacterized protein LOC129716732 n=1 Tax=Wyeomyia smithii TaxID=174621 RepID=UPI002468012B|nr:uncharacterized protein LOC129716732 [Wyeomyia smithii]
MADGQRINLPTTKRATMIAALGRAEAFLVGYSDQRDAPQVPLRLEYINNIWATLNEVQAELEAYADTDEVDFLQRRIRVLESISVNDHAPGSQTTPSTNQAANFNRRQSQFRLSSNASTAIASYKCPACNGNHYIARCAKFMQQSVSERKQLVSRKRLCHNFLKGNHLVASCPCELNCRKCNQRHHTLLHLEQSGNIQRSGNDSASRSANPASSTTQSASTSLGNSKEQTSVPATEIVPVVETSAPVQQPAENVFLLTVVVNVIDAYGHAHPARALLDSASQPNLISNRLARILRLKRKSVNITVQGAGQMSKMIQESLFATITSRKRNISCGVEFLIMDKVTADLPAQFVSTAEWNLPTDSFLADPAFNKSQPIDMVIGVKHFYSFFPSSARMQLRENLPLLVDSVFGWVVAGSAGLASSTSQQPSCSVVAVSMITLEESVERFWKTEDLATTDNYSVEERRCESFFTSTVARTHEGRYMVRLPRKPDFAIMLGESEATARRRFELLERRLQRDPDLKAEYHKFMREYLDLGHMKPVKPRSSDDTDCYYLPHHPVFKDSSTTTKVRVVFDGSAKTSTGFSLNESLCVGPVVQDELIGTILRFRTYPIALVGDIAKMYRQVLVHPDDTSLQRILWRFSADDPIQIYELLTVTYGLTPSSFLATRTLQQLADDEGEPYPFGSKALRKNFYVDDFIGGAQTVEEASKLRTELSELLAKGGFNLRKWTSNRLEVLKGLREDQIGTQSTIEFAPHETIKALGINWEPNEGFLRFDSQVPPSDHVLTKRSILSTITKLFDPLGLIAPVVVRAKIVMQELWLLSCGWDDPVPDNLQKRWEKYQQELPKISAYRIARYALLPNSTVQLHTFADASESAYGACTYARCEDPQGIVRIQLLASKSRVAPLKRLTIARLELCAAILAAHLHHRIKRAIDIGICSSYFWSDSSVTLEWLRSPPNRWQTFVGNRVSEVQHCTHGYCWNHIAGTENPADLVSRGMSVEEFLNSALWSQGPSWLTLPCKSWPISNPDNVSEDILEIRQVVAAVNSTSTVNPLFLRCSSYTRLLHVVGYCLRFILNNRAKTRTQPLPSPNPVQRYLSVEQLAQTRNVLIQLAQSDGFPAELKDLREGNFHPFSLLIAQHYHHQMFHAGGRLLLSAIREEFWPLQGRKLAHNTVRRCFRCTRLDPVPAQQQIGQLPAHRLIPSRPFSVTGVDYAGPFYLKPIHKRAAPAKAYLCLFICFATKAVHLELVSDLSTPGFLLALRRFIARRGRPAHIHSDNGKNFEGAKNDLNELFAMLRKSEENEKIASTCAAEGITWHLTPPKAPHFGGLWEAAVKVAKKHLYRQLGSSRVSFEDLSTILAQIEALMNSRPLLPMSDDPNDLAALTPAHFLIGSSMLALPDPDHQHIPVNRLDHFQKLQLHVQKFWSHWRTEYLQELQRDTTMNPRNHTLLPGRLVVVVDELQPPIRWPLARIVTTSPGPDGLTRVVSLRTARGIITRPITKICLLPDHTAAVAEGDEAE